jgi:hypothetical protein
MLRATSIRAGVDLVRATEEIATVGARWVFVARPLAALRPGRSASPRSQGKLTVALDLSCSG